MQSCWYTYSLLIMPTSQHREELGKDWFCSHTRTHTHAVAPSNPIGKHDVISACFLASFPCPMPKPLAPSSHEEKGWVWVRDYAPYTS